MMKHVIVLGGGFAGVAAIHTLLTHQRASYIITLIDEHTYHLFTPSLYEVATSETPQKNIAIPYRVIFKNRIRFIKDSVTHIDTRKQLVLLAHTTPIPYDYLLVTVGSEPAYYQIPGMQKYAVALKSIHDAVTIREKIKNLCCAEGKYKKNVQVIIAGGGFAGTELAAELMTYKNRLSKQFRLESNCLQLTIVQGSSRLLNELDPHASSLAETRIKENGIVTFAFGGHIRSVTAHKVYTDNNKTYPFDILIWTGGIKANHLASTSHLPVTSNGSLMVNPFLQVEGFTNIFAAGDIAYVSTKENHSAPAVAQVAEEEGRIAGENCARLINGKTLLSYPYRHWGYIVPLKGHFAVAEFMGIFHFDGFFGWILQQLIFLRYLLGILPFWKAMQKWNRFEEELQK